MPKTNSRSSEKPKIIFEPAVTSASSQFEGGFQLIQLLFHPAKQALSKRMLPFLCHINKTKQAKNYHFAMILYAALDFDEHSHTQKNVPQQSSLLLWRKVRIVLK